MSCCFLSSQTSGHLLSFAVRYVLAWRHCLLFLSSSETFTWLTWQSVFIDRFHTEPFSAVRADSLRSSLVWLNDCRFTQRVFEYPPKWWTYSAVFVFYMAGVTWNYFRLGARSEYTIQPCTNLQCHFIRSHRSRVHVCLAVTFHLCV